MNDDLVKLEVFLFANGGSVKMSKLANVLNLKIDAVKDLVKMLMEKKNTEDSGIYVILNNNEVELVTNPEYADFVMDETKREVQSELTAPQLETLTVIAYRGPVSRAELEHIRGVNCQVILRNLNIRGLIVEKFDEDILQNRYTISGDFLKMLGLQKISDLPRYDEFNGNEHISNLLSELVNQE